MAYPIKKMAANNRAVPPSASYFSRLRKNIKTYYQLYILIIPVLAYYIIFHYGPMYGAQIAFRNFTPADGIFQSPWVGLTHFKTYFNNPRRMLRRRKYAVFSKYGSILAGCGEFLNSGSEHIKC